MITQESYNNGFRCRGMCQLCNKNINECYQYITDIKGTKFDIKEKENNIYEEMWNELLNFTKYNEIYAEIYHLMYHIMEKKLKDKLI